MLSGSGDISGYIRQWGTTTQVIWLDSNSPWAAARCTTACIVYVVRGVKQGQARQGHVHKSMTANAPLSRRRGAPQTGPGPAGP